MTDRTNDLNDAVDSVRAYCHAAYGPGAAEYPAEAYDLLSSLSRLAYTARTAADRLGVRVVQLGNEPATFDVTGADPTVVADEAHELIRDACDALEAAGAALATAQSVVANLAAGRIDAAP